MLKHLIFFTILLIILTNMACYDMQKVNDNSKNLIIYSLNCSESFKISKGLSNTEWEKAPAYKMHLPMDKGSYPYTPDEQGSVKFLWNENYFYVGIEFFDSNIIATGKKDNLPHYKLGDVCEVFIAPPDKSWYRELFITPAGKKSSYIHKEPHSPEVDESFNIIVYSKITDKGWSGVMRIPRVQNNVSNQTLSENWYVLVSRFNYRDGIECRENLELSAIVNLSATNFHLLKEYGKLKFIK